MAKRKGYEEKKLDINEEVRRLRERGPERLYLLWGKEDYLREYFLQQLKQVCLPEGEDSFSYRRLNGPALDVQTLREAVDAMPFLTDRSLVEIRDLDLNRLKEPEAVLKVLSDLPDYCTVVLVQHVDFEPDGRVKAIKGLRTVAYELRFESQSLNALTKWIAKRFAACGKGVEMEAAQRLIFVSGDLMNRLIPEIEKIAAYAKGAKVTAEDVDAVASHIPEADIFQMLDLIAQKKFNAALTILADLQADKDKDPIYLSTMLGIQVRNLYAARLAFERNLGMNWLLDSGAVKYDFQARKLYQAARGYTLPQLRQAVELCAETDYRMKSGETDRAGLFREAVLRIAAEACDG